MKKSVQESQREDLAITIKSLDDVLLRVEAVIREASQPSDPGAVDRGEAVDDTRRRGVLLIAARSYAYLLDAKRSYLDLFKAQGGVQI